MKIAEAKKKFPHAKVLECTEVGDEYIIVRPNGVVVCALAVHVHLNVGKAPGEDGTETCVDVFTPDTRGVEIAHFEKEGRAKFHNMSYSDVGTRRSERGMHLVGVIRRPGGVK
jgi:hypothetical protein